MKRSAGTALAVIAAAAVIVVALVVPSALGASKTVTSVSTSISTVSVPNTVTEIVVSNHTVTSDLTTDQPYALVVNAAATVSGSAASIPGCTVHGGCTSSANQSSTAMLILYDDTYYYVSDYAVTGSTSVVYTVWYTNSTEFCVSPAVSGDAVCPNAVFIQETSVQSHTQTPQTTSSSQSISCTITGEGGPLFVEVVTAQGAPVAEQGMNVVHMGPTVNGQYCGTASLPPIFTNATGWVQVPGGDGLPFAGSFAISFSYGGQVYSTTVPIIPATETFVTIYVPSGQVDSTNCPYGYCSTYSDTMMMGG